MEAIRRDVHEHIAEIMVEWREITRDEPWLSLPEEHRTNSLPAVALALVDVALRDRPQGADYEAVVVAAAKHGRTRGEHAFPISLIFTEYHLLREALWRHLRTRFAQAAGAMVLVDSAITVATSASLFGFNRDQLEATGAWPAVLQELIDEAPRRIGRWGAGGGPAAAR